VFQQLPWRVRPAYWFAAAQVGRKVFKRFAEIDMRFCLGKQIGDVLADGIAFLHGN
jgi:hypothetical protein